MKKEYNIDELVSGIDFWSNKYEDIGNGLILTNREISVLKHFNIDYLACSSLKEILYRIENVRGQLDDDDLDELDFICTTIAERDYYQNTNK